VRVAAIFIVADTPRIRKLQDKGLSKRPARTSILCSGCDWLSTLPDTLFYDRRTDSVSRSADTREVRDLVKGVEVVESTDVLIRAKEPTWVSAFPN
jgi:hypothetical protein